MIRRFAGLLLLLLFSPCCFPLQSKPKVSLAAWSGVHGTVKGQQVRSGPSLVA